MVALIHFGCPYFGRGYLGVDFFSFISGFVILLTYQNSDSDLHFLCKRFVRLWAVIVPLVLLYSIISQTDFLLKESFTFEFGEYPKWTIRKEAAFYLMSPLAFPLLNYLHSKNWLHYFLLFWLTLFFGWFFFINSPLLLNESNHYFGIDVHENIFTPLPNRDSLGFERMFLEYFLGAICARLFLDDKLITNPKLDHFCFAFLAIGIAMLDSRYDIFVFLAGVYLMISRTNNFLKIFFRTKAMRFLGKISFST